MAPPNIPAVKRAGLPVDIDRLAEEGDAWLTPEDRYALKTWGVCTQLQDHVFMVRIRVPGGVLPTAQARAIARVAARHGSDWVHLTTRQNVELHWVADRSVRDALGAIEQAGLSTRSACGHTLRNVMSSEDAGVALDEPFDCFPDARAVSDAILARSAELNCVLPSRINAAFGGSPRCREDALLNDVAFVSTIVGGEPGYRLYAGGSLGKAPALAIELHPFVPRADVVAAAEALTEVFVANGDFERPAKGRMKFCIEAMGEEPFRSAWRDAFAAARRRPHAEPVPVALPAPGDRAAAIRRRPEGGWSAGVRPQHQPGFACVTVQLPLGDTNQSELELLANLADLHGDGHLVLGRDQDVIIRNVAVDGVEAIREALRPRGLHLLGEGSDAAIRACTGSAVCALGISPAPASGRTLLATAGLRRNSALRVHVSGCPNSCAQHQAGDIGLAGTKVRLGGATRLGYHLYLGADLAAGRVGEVVGRMAAEDAPAVIDAVIGTWEATRHGGETLSATVARLGIDAFSATLEAVLEDRWASGPEPEAEPADGQPERPRLTPVAVERRVPAA
jgi:sulfite reductase beta subunit-like hemoprotein